MRTAMRWVVRLGVVAAVGALVARVVGRGRRTPDGGIVPPVDGDLWPPVPVNPDRTA